MSNFPTTSHARKSHRQHQVVQNQSIIWLQVKALAGFKMVDQTFCASELRSSVKVDIAILGSPSLII